MTLRPDALIKVTVEMRVKADGSDVQLDYKSNHVVGY
jgi:hypothetical protein